VTWRRLGSRLIDCFQHRASAAHFELRRIDKSEDAALAMGDVMQALAEGRITVNEAERIARMLRALVAALDAMIFGHTSHQAYQAEWTREYAADSKKRNDENAALSFKA
jgi:hypothetical protein